MYSKREKRERNKEDYLKRIAKKISKDDTPYNTVFSRWEFIPNTKQNVDFHTALCQICENTFLKHLYKIKIKEQYRNMLQEGQRDYYWVGSVCVQNFCHKDEIGKFIRSNQRKNFISNISKKKKKENFYESLDERLEMALQNDNLKNYHRFYNVLQQIKVKRMFHNNRYVFETVTEAIVFTVALKYRSLKQITRFFFKILPGKKIHLSTLELLEGNELKFFSSCCKKYDNRSYEIVDIDEDYSDDEEDSIETPSGPTVQIELDGLQ